MKPENCVDNFVPEIDIYAIFDKWNEKFEKETEKMQRVNILVTGKTGVGKSTVINSVFGKELAKTGSGIPITAEIEKYTVGYAKLVIYDTKGIELSEKSQKDVKKKIEDHIFKSYQSSDMSEAIHAIWYCISSVSNRIEVEEIEFLKEIQHYKDMKIPVIIVLTKSYSKSEAEELRQCIVDQFAQDDDFEQEIPVIPVLCKDYYYDKDHFSPAFGLEELVMQTVHLLPDYAKSTFINSQVVSLQLKRKQAHQIIAGAATAAGVVGAAPIPWADAPVLVAAQVAMIVKITYIFQLEVDKAKIMSLVTTMLGCSGATIIGKTVVSNLLKMIPVAGSVAGGAISATTAVLLTTALGKAYARLLEEVARGEIDSADIGDKKSSKILKAMFKEELKIACKKEKMED